MTRTWNRSPALFCAYAGLPIALGTIAAAFASLPPVTAPTENPITEQKRVLGKILFFDEQMSASNTVACATCHVLGRAGSDPRVARNPGVDGIFNTPDDLLTSPGVIHSDATNFYVWDTKYGLNPQASGRAAPSPIDAAYAPELFWDGRASGQFVDPQTGQVAIVSGGALESQCVNPPVSSVEMGHDGIDWNAVTAKLARVRPLDLATNMPPDVQGVLASHPSYPDLFRQAFGDAQITSQRVAFALGTYERTLIADQTPWDRFVAGDPTALTQGQQAGLNFFNNNCNVCHTAPLFSNEGFRNIGLRPPAEDLGRQNVTGDTNDRGKFKVPSLRNAGLKTSYMHNGEFTNVGQVVGFYAHAPGAPPQFPDNRDPLIGALRIPPQVAPALIDFVTNGLTDPRVAQQTFPFDRPMLFTERAANQASNQGGGVAGSGGIVPRLFISDPAMVGNQDFRIGLDQALGNASATLAISSNPPINGQIAADSFIGTLTAAGTGNGQGLATLRWPLDPSVVSGGQVLFMQWVVGDGSAVGGQAMSNVVRVPIFCGSYGCPLACYVNCDNSAAAPILNANDFQCFLGKFAIGDAYANCDGSTTPPVLNANDFQCFLNKYAVGCP
jgi:cytochrome c peroxidase